MTGAGKDAYALAAKINSAWINFAAKGGPNAAGLIKWPVYTDNGAATMMLNIKSIVMNNPDADLLKIAASVK